MNSGMLNRASAVRYAGWFKALADPTRVQLVTLLAKHRRSMTVGEIVAASGVGQSTVSHHLKALAEVRFVLSEQRGTARWYRINDACVDCFPSAADIVMGREVPEPPACDSPETDTPRSKRHRAVTARRQPADRIPASRKASNPRRVQP